MLLEESQLLHGKVRHEVARLAGTHQPLKFGFIRQAFEEPGIHFASIVLTLLEVLENFLELTFRFSFSKRVRLEEHLLRRLDASENLFRITIESI